MNSSAVVLFPGALGDFLVFLPTLFALAERHKELLLFARTEWTSLLNHPRIQCRPLEHPAVTALFSETFVAEGWRKEFGEAEQAYSWTGYGVAAFSANLAQLTRQKPAIFPFRAFRPSEHAIDYYARCAEVIPATPALVRSYLRYHSSPLVRKLERCRKQWLAIHPGSGAVAKNWLGFASLATRWKREGRGPVVVFLGPAEIERKVPVDNADLEFVASPLPEVAAALRLASFYVGNDSGVSHLAALLGARALVLMGPSSAPQHWQPRGQHTLVVYAAKPCVLCGPEVFCEHLVSSEQVLCWLDSNTFPATLEKV